MIKYPGHLNTTTGTVIVEEWPSHLRCPRMIYFTVIIISLLLSCCIVTGALGVWEESFASRTAHRHVHFDRYSTHWCQNAENGQAKPKWTVTRLLAAQTNKQDETYFDKSTLELKRKGYAKDFEKSALAMTRSLPRPLTITVLTYLPLENCTFMRTN